MNNFIFIWTSEQVPIYWLYYDSTTNFKAKKSSTESLKSLPYHCRAIGGLFFVGACSLISLEIVAGEKRPTPAFAGVERADTVNWLGFDKHSQSACWRWVTPIREWRCEEPERKTHWPHCVSIRQCDPAF